MGRPRSDITGQKFGKLTAIRLFELRDQRSYWLFKCDCGGEIITRVTRVKSGSAKSCGCYRKGSDKPKRIIKHRDGAVRSVNGSKTPEYNTWRLMIKRCHNQHDKAFFRYGMRGIEVCERWRYSFPNFLADMGKKPSPEHSIDRIENDKGYFPENCRWATKVEQARNTKRNRWYEYNGKRMLFTDWVEELKIPKSTLERWLKKYTIKEIVENKAGILAQLRQNIVNVSTYRKERCDSIKNKALLTE